MPGALSVHDLVVAYDRSRVLDGLDLAVGEGEFVALLGPSGCGKTTLLRSIAGFVPVTSGRISADGRDITALPAEKRDTAMVFQSYALWPHMTTAQNIGYGLKLRGRSTEKIASCVADILALLKLDGLGDRKPAQLSGGQRQRVALGRALAVNPAFLLLDEPLSSLDAQIREGLRHEIRHLQQRLGITTIHVTHDREEAMVMADRVAVLDKGRIVQVGTPEDLYHRPTSAFVARFMGASNEIRRDETNDILLFRPDGPVLAAPSADAPSDVLRLHGRVTQVSYLGRHWRHGVDADGASIVVDHMQRIAPNTDVSVVLAPGTYFAFPRSGGTPATA
jgi:ABC-type Fe3+/spermidine/putrescine transport system ATPase subunit